MPSPALILRVPLNRFPNKLAPSVPNKILINPPFCYSLSFLVVLLKPFMNELDSSGDLNIFMTPYVSSLQINNVVLPDPIIFQWIAASIAAVVNSNVLKNEWCFKTSRYVKANKNL